MISDFYSSIGISLVLVTLGTPPPKGALCLGEQKADLAGDGEKKLWSVICDGAEHGHGKIPGKNLSVSEFQMGLTFNTHKYILYL